MSDRTRRRRTVLGTLAAIALAAPFGPAAGARNGPPDREPPGAEGDRLPPRGATGPPWNAGDAAVGVVDRIVDGRFVVILVEEDGEVVDQIVLEGDDPRLPEVSEGDVLLLWFGDEGDLVAIERLPGETERRRRRNRDRLDDVAKPLDGRGGGREE